uniref:WD domain-containing protein, G-beta repeat-containing protein n=1 Tax=Candidatus Kentrum sp. DK TaxID=2126562 RepID=A0A450SJ04_9GAMM|nr:MAG: WD domain-containing protein, G-beta repeat-containing protein [Candidatus Kentron sp. DK]
MKKILLLGLIATILPACNSIPVVETKSYTASVHPAIIPEGERIEDWDNLIALGRKKTAVQSVAIGGNADGAPIIASGLFDYTTRLWNGNTATQVHLLDDGRPDFPEETGIRSVAFCAGQYLITGSNAGVFRWNLETGNRMRFDSGEDATGPAVCDREEKFLAVAGSGELGKEVVFARLLDLESGRRIRDFSASTAQYGKAPAASGKRILVTSVAFSPSGDLIATASGLESPSGHLTSQQGYGLIRLWNTETGALIREFAPYGGAVNAVVFTPDGKQLLSGSSDGIIRLWDVGRILAGNRQRLHPVERTGHAGPINAIAIGGDGKTILSGSDDKKVGLWDLGSDRVQFFPGHTRPVSAVATGFDTASFVSGSADGTVRFWNLASGTWRMFAMARYGTGLWFGCVRGAGPDAEGHVCRRYDDGTLVGYGGSDGRLRPIPPEGTIPPKDLQLAYMPTRLDVPQSGEKTFDVEVYNNGLTPIYWLRLAPEEYPGESGLKFRASPPLVTLEPGAVGKLTAKVSYAESPAVGSKTSLRLKVITAYGEYAEPELSPIKVVAAP